MHDFKEYFPSMKVRGVEVSDYAVAESMPLVKPYIVKSDFTELPFENREFDFVIASGVVLYPKSKGSNLLPQRKYSGLERETAL